MQQITVILNGEKIKIAAETLLNDFLAKQAQHSSFALAINESFIPKDYYDEVTLRDGDNIELLSPMQGG